MVKKDGKPVSSQKSEDRPGKIRIYGKTSKREVKLGAINTPQNFGAALDQLRNETGETDFVMDAVVDPADLNKTAISGWGHGLVRADLEKYVSEELKCRLSAQDFQIFRDRKSDHQDDATRERIHEALDDVIMQAAFQRGPAIFLVPAVLQRVCDWTTEDNELRWPQLAERFALIGPVVRGQRNAPLEGWWVRFRTPILEEMKLLQKILREQFAKRSELLSARALSDAAVAAIDSGDRFPALSRIGEIFQLFLAARPLSAPSLLSGDITPALLTDELIGWATNRDPESARQRISELQLSRKRTNRS